MTSNAVKAPPAQAPDKPRRKSILGYLLILPAVLYVSMLVIVPLAQGLRMSLHNTKLLNPTGGKFVGLDNYSAILGDSGFLKSVLATFLYTGMTVLGTLAVGVSAALLVNRSFRARGLVRAILTFPYATPTVAVALVFSWMYASKGILNRGTSALGIGEVGWLTDTQFGMISVVAATVWKVAPFVMLVVLAALQSVPEEVREASRVDGANALATFRLVVIPHIAPTLRIVALLMTIWSIRRFEVIYLLTGGGPVESTNTLVINIYRTAFSNQNLGEAAAIGAVSLVISLIVTVVFFLVDNREAKKEAQ